MTAAEARKILSADKSFALVSLRGRSLADHEQILAAELARKRPRKLLIARLREQISQLTATPI